MSATAGILQTKNYRQFTVVTESGYCIAEFEGAKSASKAFSGDLVQWNPDSRVCTVLGREKDMANCWYS